MLGFGLSGSIFDIGLTIRRDITDDITADIPVNNARNTAAFLISPALIRISDISITVIAEMAAAAADQMSMLINIFFDTQSSPAL